MEKRQPDSQIESGDNNQNSRREFIQRVLIVVGIVTAVGLLLVLLWQSADVILLIFAGTLVAVLLHSLAEWLSRHTPLSQNWALTAVLLLIAAIVALGGWLFFPTLKEQFDLLTEELPQTVERVRETVSQNEVGRWILQQIPAEPQQIMGNQPSRLLARITGYFSTFLGVLVDVLIILATGIYFAFSPQLYKNGVIKLFPKGKQERVGVVLETLGITLRRWLVGRFAVMTMNGALTALGLWMLGVPIPLLLGLMTGILNFIPNFGPIIAAVPAILLALTQGETQAIYVTVLYLIIQNLDGFVFTPLVQQRSVELPPVLILSSQLLLGVSFGFLGILLSVPLVAVGYVLVRMLYVEDTLDNRVEVLGEKQAEENRAT